MAILDDFANELLKLTSSSLEELSSTALNVSELTLLLTNTQEFLLEFEVLGQNFLLSPKGIHTFNELGDVLEPAEEFQRALKAHLNWRLAILRRFQL